MIRELLDIAGRLASQAELVGLGVCSEVCMQMRLRACELDVLHVCEIAVLAVQSFARDSVNESAR
eukprot:10793087-Lingulodinium_polyedra.AAC.1